MKPTQPLSLCLPSRLVACFCRFGGFVWVRVQMPLYPHAVDVLEGKQTWSWDEDMKDDPQIILSMCLCASVLLYPSAHTLHLPSSFCFFCLSLLPCFSILPHPLPLSPALLPILFFSFDIHAWINSIAFFPVPPEGACWWITGIWNHIMLRFIISGTELKPFYFSGRNNRWFLWGEGVSSVSWLVRKKPRRLTLAAQDGPASRGD